MLNDLRCLILRLIKFRFFIYFSLLFFFRSEVVADCGSPIRGVNLAGAQFAPKKIPGVLGADFRFPTESHVRYYADSGFNAIRFPVLWERLQPNLNGELNEEYALAIEQVLGYAKAHRMRVLLDLHNYGRFREGVVGEEISEAAFSDLWMRVAIRFRDSTSLFAYGLMNEPHSMPDRWGGALQRAVDAIRRVDGVRYIYVPGNNWSSAQKWAKSHPEPFVTDPVRKVVYEAHVYFDRNSSGEYESFEISLDKRKRVSERLNPFLEWLKRNKQHGAIGEWGVPSNDASWFDAADSFISIANEQCLDWYVWAGGAWTPTYKLSLEPSRGVEKELLLLIKGRLLNYKK